MWFFTNYPNVNYLTLDDTLFTVTDITKRFKFVEKVLKNKYVLFNYTIKEGERPDILAHKYYGDTKLDWIIMLTNKIINPYFDWPLTNAAFEAYIIKKYKNLEFPKTTYSKYYQIIQKKEITYDGFQVPERLLEIDANAYQSLPESDKKRNTIYQEEYNMNESRKNIKIIEKSFVPQIIKEAENIYGKL